MWLWWFASHSPACSSDAMYFVILTASVRKWQMKTFDFTSAFLQGGILESEVFLWPPPDVCPQWLIWKLKRCIYGLNDAPHSWYKRDNHELTNLKRIVRHIRIHCFFDMMQLVIYRYSGNTCRWFHNLWNWYISDECDLRIKKNIQSWNAWKWNLQIFGD